MPGSPGAQFGAVAKAHVMHRVIRLICGFQCDWQHRLAVSFDNESVHVFRVTEDVFSEFQSIESPYANWSPRTFVGLGDGAFCISAQFPDPANSKKIHYIRRVDTVQKNHSAECHSAEKPKCRKTQCRTVVVQKWEMCLLFLVHASQSGVM